LSTGGSFASIAVYFGRGESKVGGIVTETVKVIWEVLEKTFMPIPSTEQLKGIAKRFETLWNLPNSIGAIDGKHARIEKYSNSGSSNFNYKSCHSMVLMACCDADGLFTLRLEINNGLSAKKIKIELDSKNRAMYHRQQPVKRAMCHDHNIGEQKDQTNVVKAMCRVWL
jgi:hypothetical protein